MTEVLALSWAVIIGFCIIMYVLLDGFDLGVGILFPFFPDKHDRSIMVSSILPVWDGNQTWLVLGGASLYGAFPYAFSLLMPALYGPLFIMVIALLFRGITFEFRLKAKKGLRSWEMLFFLSSATATFTQGVLLGTFVDGYHFDAEQNLIANVLTPFNITCGVALLFGYGLLGSAWIIAKTKNTLQEKMFNVAKICLAVVTMFLIVISFWTPLIEKPIADIWFNPHYFFKLALLPAVTTIIICSCALSLARKKEYVIFWQAIGIFICAYVGFGISTFPYIVPRVITIWQAAAPPSSLLFMLFGALLLLPVLIAYTSYSYYVFRGKVTEIIGY